MNVGCNYYLEHFTVTALQTWVAYIPVLLNSMLPFLPNHPSPWQRLEKPTSLCYTMSSTDLQNPLTLTLTKQPNINWHSCRLQYSHKFHNRVIHREPINNLTHMMLIKTILLLSLAVTVSGKIDSFLTFFEFECVSIGFMKNYPFWFLLYLLPLPILVLLKLNNYSLNLKTDWSTTSFTATDSSSVFLLPLDYCIFFTFFLCPRCFCFRFFFTCCPFFSLLLFLK